MTYRLHTAAPPDEIMRAVAQEGVAAADWYEGDPPPEALAHDLLDAADILVAAFIDQLDADYQWIDVRLRGYANEGHAPYDGWADEFLTVTVRAARNGPDDE